MHIKSLHKSCSRVKFLNIIAIDGSDVLSPTADSYVGRFFSPFPVFLCFLLAFVLYFYRFILLSTKNVYRNILLLIFLLLFPFPNGLPHPTIILLNSTGFHLHDTNTPLAPTQTKTNCPPCLSYVFVFPDETFQTLFSCPLAFF